MILSVPSMFEAAFDAVLRIEPSEHVGVLHKEHKASHITYELATSEGYDANGRSYYLRGVAVGLIRAFDLINKSITSDELKDLCQRVQAS